MNEVSPWAEYGLVGLVLFALFSLLVWVVRGIVAHLDTAEARHRDERREWKREADTREEKLRFVVDKLADAVRDLKR